ncbi:HORMA domain-containing protein 1 isoform X2 [Nerophis lumbriciformis]|uniref:HORMA domain-containing protein 1 isoform X2 n=1 Tax=Nerophis lumbriciformis TaxID=546530 RepID=UPI002ADF1C7B|nr:HORMA domain-containing protein 1 isoform X2 [Nerophis lumbriciformis]
MCTTSENISGHSAVAQSGCVGAAVHRCYQETSGHCRVWHHIPKRTFSREGLREQICGRLDDKRSSFIEQRRNNWFTLHNAVKYENIGMQGCFDAIQMKYLRTVIMSVYTDADNPQKVTEFYQFRIHYNSDGAKMDFESNHNEKLSTISCGSTKKASILLVRKLYTLMQNLGPLPESVYLNMKLAYYDDVTPQDYQPPGFKEADGNTLVFGKEPVRLTMGEVVTPFHTIQLDMATERQRLEPVEETVGGKDKWILRIHDEGVVSQSHVVEDVDAPDNNSNGIELMCHENTYEVTEMKTVSKKTSDMETTTMTTRSGRILKSTTCALQTNGMLKNRKEAAMKDKLVSKYDIPNSQETPRKKRKFSEPKEHL